MPSVAVARRGNRGMTIDMGTSTIEAVTIVRSK